jgi:hypothetical protein
MMPRSTRLRTDLQHMAARLKMSLAVKRCCVRIRATALARISHGGWDPGLTLCALGYCVIRIWNNNVIETLDGVLQTLLSELEKRPLTPALSPPAGRGRRLEP